MSVKGGSTVVGFSLICGTRPSYGDYKLGHAQPLEYTNLSTLLCVGQITICLTCVKLALLITVSYALGST